ncbi:hypothetical protein [Methanobacterium aggregans]|uniref:hypothetical protein n=1 Tax=Methanobacterium aggregans TaxID=1615586 RepID=UPI001AEB52EC|nr:hypothetical protein [Methanobacterium aggregans]MBP2045361.1 putative membrane protein YdbT with pleckstrin-like domain [Methanobacterium aggregans]
MEPDQWTPRKLYVALIICNVMAGSINLWGGALSLILGVGAVILAALNNQNWPMFLLLAIFIFLITFSRELRSDSKK